MYRSTTPDEAMIREPGASGPNVSRIATLRDSGSGAESRPPRPYSGRHCVGSLTVDAENWSVTLSQKRILLTTSEFELLWYLVQHCGEVLSRDQLYRNVRGIEYNGLDRSIDLRVSQLRKKLEEDPTNPRRIVTIRGTGYLLTKDQ